MNSNGLFSFGFNLIFYIQYVQTLKLNFINLCSPATSIIVGDNWLFWAFLFDVMRVNYRIIKELKW